MSINTPYTIQTVAAQHSPGAADECLAACQKQIAANEYRVYPD